MIDVERIRELAKKSEQQPVNKDGLREATREELIVRQNCLSHADAMFGKLTGSGPYQTLSEDLDAYFRFAEQCERWILRTVKR